MNTDILTPNHFVFPVFGGRVDKDGFFIPTDLYGTAFYINNGFFLTCCHTAENVKQNEISCLGFLNENMNISYKSIVDVEYFPDNDSAILISNIDNAVTPKWLDNDLAMLEQVISIGYPFGYDRLNRKLYTRSFQGYISHAGHYHTFPKKPAHYELSFMCPKGISGAPLLCKVNNEMIVCGMVIGNEITEMIVSSFKETVVSTNEIKTIERSEAFHRGIAVQSKSFFDLKSDFLEGTFREYLKKEGLLIGR